MADDLRHRVPASRVDIQSICFSVPVSVFAFSGAVIEHDVPVHDVRNALHPLHSFPLDAVHSRGAHKLALLLRRKLSSRRFFCSLLQLAGGQLRLQGFADVLLFGLLRCLLSRLRQYDALFRSGRCIFCISLFCRQ